MKQYELTFWWNPGFKQWEFEGTPPSKTWGVILDYKDDYVTTRWSETLNGWIDEGLAPIRGSYQELRERPSDPNVKHSKNFQWVDLGYTKVLKLLANWNELKDDLPRL